MRPTYHGGPCSGPLRNASGELSYNEAMFWTAGFLRKWIPVIGWTAAWRLREATIYESGNRRAAEFEIPLPEPWMCSFRVRVPGTDLFTFQDVFLNGIYDRAIARVSACQRIVDLGANIGCATLRFAGRCPEAKIAAVEPMPGNMQVLERNTAGLRASGRVQLFPAAIWGRETRLVVANPDNAHATRGELREAQSGDSGPCIDGMPADLLFDRAGFDEVDLMKIDVEGAEVPLFRGNTGWLGRVKAIAIEFHRESRVASGFDAIMARHHYHVEELGHGTVFAARA